VLSVGNQGFLMLHEKAFANPGELLAQLRDLLGPEFVYVLAREKELSAKAAVAAYPFNSQVLELSDGSMAIVAPRESQASRPARSFLERVVAEENPVRSIHYLDLRQSMKNGGGPACLRLRIWLTEEEVSAISGNVLYTPELHRQLEQWIRQHYRDRLVPGDLRDPALARESMTALDELSRLLQLGNIYDFQL
jgi:succinylarginine dihydrolase